MNFGKLQNYKIDGQKVILNFEKKQATVEVLTSQIVNVFCGLESDSHDSKAIEGNKSVPVSIAVEEKVDGLWIDTGAVKVRVSDHFFVDFFDADGNEVCMDYRGERKPLEVISADAEKLLAGEGHEAWWKQEPFAFEIRKKCREVNISTVWAIKPAFWISAIIAMRCGIRIILHRRWIVLRHCTRRFRSL